MTPSFAPTIARVTGCANDDVLAAATSDAWERVCAAYPELATDGDAFFAYVAARLDGDPAIELARRHLADLVLAWGCERSDAQALAILERDVMPIVERALASFGDRSELLQILRERMLVEKLGRLGIAAYDGRAPLATWLRVCATRIGLREQDRERRTESLDDRDLDQLAPGVPDPELAYLKRLYGDAFRDAFAAAVASLAVRERNLLRLSVIDGLGIDQLAAIFHVHRATAARQLKQARAALVAATRDRMRVALAISPSELDSIMRMIQSLADVSLRHVLAPGSGI